ncbi:MAG: Bax inhibitor-1/YccA family protein [Myxococcota bacterium]|nr:Bax inhibitor-1/YccA family protein [Myxococcota bacterium]
MRTGNPTLNDNIFSDAMARGGAQSDRMTLSGTINKTGLLLLMTVISAGYSWSISFVPGNFGEAATFQPSVLGIGGSIAGFVFALVTIFKKTAAPITAPLYAICEGLFLGVVSAGFETKFPGIVFQAILGTFGTLFALLGAYRSGLIKATENFRLGVVAATGGIFFVYLISFVLGFFGMSVPGIHGSGLLGIGFSVVVVGVAALNLVLDFDFIENGAEAGAPKYMEWYGAFGLLVTLVWLYLEILRLLSKLSSRD